MIEKQMDKNGLSIFNGQQLPDTLEDLTQFVLVGKAKLDAYMLKLRTVNRLSTAQDIRDQTLKEAQEVSTALIAAEQRIGELLLAIPKATANNNPSGKSGTQNRDESKLGKTKTETVKEMGYTKDEASDYQQMAKNPDVVNKVLDDAIANGTVVTKSQVMKEIAEAKRQAKAENEKLRKALSESEAKRISAEKNQRNVEVLLPDDYEELKDKASQVDNYKKDYQRMVNERQKVVDENLEMKQQLREMKEQTAEAKTQFKLEEDSEYFAIRTYDFIKNNAGYIYIFDKINELPDENRQHFVKAIYALDACVKQMVENIGGYGIE